MSKKENIHLITFFIDDRHQEILFVSDQKNIVICEEIYVLFIHSYNHTDSLSKMFFIQYFNEPLHPFQRHIRHHLTF